jgi:hypothetical protein
VFDTISVKRNEKQHTSRTRPVPKTEITNRPMFKDMQISHIGDMMREDLHEIWQQL